MEQLFFTACIAVLFAVMGMRVALTVADIVTGCRQTQVVGKKPSTCRLTGDCVDALPRSYGATTDGKAIAECQGHDVRSLRH